MSGLRMSIKIKTNIKTKMANDYKKEKPRENHNYTKALGQYS